VSYRQIDTIAVATLGLALLLTNVGLLSSAPGSDGSAAKASAKPNKAKEALAQFNSLIGGWRGIGQPRRGSAAGSWQETANWVWDFSQPKTPAIKYEVTDGKLIKEARVTFDEPTGQFHATVTLANGTTRDYAGKFEEDHVILESLPDAKHETHRLTITRLNEKRTTVLIEKKRATARIPVRVAEVGYTREGTRLAVEGGDGPECVVTGGKGTIQITYKGQTYYVCCSGCKQAFNENPEKILAEYRERIAKRNSDAK
jgi:YHS domain-containing protein